ncbi:DUF3027 domain-containing protein [Schaalia sp. lx-260]|nr:DUF3027 domain-containing protein [Schaalia sp. lx-260]MCD4548993.1 DUF3027 domain-containing protein [Schaalia sp. lx-260]
MPKTKSVRKIRIDEVLASATLVAREAVAEFISEEHLGDHCGFVMEAERLGTHFFHSLKPGYRGWCWAVSVARAPRSRTVTICEIDMLPAEGALLAPEWIPWEQRLRPGDYGREDTIPYNAHDERLEPNYESADENLEVYGANEPGYGRVRVLSAEGISQAASRWYRSDQGPRRGRLPKDTCSTCGFLMKMSGSMRSVFGVCANEWSQDDGRVVSLDHACGAHSETDAPKTPSDWTVRPSRINDFSVETEKLS